MDFVAVLVGIIAGYFMRAMLVPRTTPSSQDEPVFTQIFATTDHENSESLYAVADDGSVYELACKFFDTPTEKNPYLRRGVYYWKLVSMSCSEPTELPTE